MNEIIKISNWNKPDNMILVNITMAYMWNLQSESIYYIMMELYFSGKCLTFLENVSIFDNKLKIQLIQYMD